MGILRCMLQGQMAIIDVDLIATWPKDGREVRELQMERKWHG